jgi:hypothetical protein
MRSDLHGRLCPFGTSSAHLAGTLIDPSGRHRSVLLIGFDPCGRHRPLGRITIGSSNRYPTISPPDRLRPLRSASTLGSDNHRLLQPIPHRLFWSGAANLPVDKKTSALTAGIDQSSWSAKNIGPYGRHRPVLLVGIDHSWSACLRALAQALALAQAQAQALAQLSPSSSALRGDATLAHSRIAATCLAQEPW